MTFAPLLDLLLLEDLWLSLDDFVCPPPFICMRFSAAAAPFVRVALESLDAAAIRSLGDFFLDFFAWVFARFFLGSALGLPASFWLTLACVSGSEPRGKRAFISAVTSLSSRSELSTCCRNCSLLIPPFCTDSNPTYGRSPTTVAWERGRVSSI